MKLTFENVYIFSLPNKRSCLQYQYETVNYLTIEDFFTFSLLFFFHLVLFFFFEIERLPITQQLGRVTTK